MCGKEESPKGWILASVHEFAEVIMGQSPPSATYNDKGIGLPFFQGKAEFSEFHPVAEKWCNKPKKVAKNNDVLLSVRAPVGAVNIADRECCIGRGLAAVRYQYNYKFIYYYFRLIGKELDKKGTGTTFRAISGEIIKNTRVLLPPLPEQHRIVAKIEELFSSLDKGIENLKTVQQQLKVYRQAVLKWAFEGKLTNQNVVDGELPEGWKREPLGKVDAKITDGEHFRPKTQERGIPFLSAKDVRDEGVSFANPLFISEETAKKAMQRCNPERGDILIVSRGATVGRICIVKTDKKFCLLGSVILIKVKNNPSSQYLTYVLKSPTINVKMVAVSGATAQQAIYLRDIKSIELPIPPLPEQEAIVTEIESRLSICDRIEETINESLKQAEALRQSILKRAFEGKLVPQDPNDEPASMLLARIRSEREKIRDSENPSTKKGPRGNKIFPFRDGTPSPSSPPLKGGKKENKPRSAI